MKKNKYTVDYFIKKFKAIPRKLWVTENYKAGDGKFCALGHLGQRHPRRPTKESNELEGLFLDNLHLKVWEVNDANHNEELDADDGLDEYADSNYYIARGKHPRTRILNALKDIKKRAAV